MFSDWTIPCCYLIFLPILPYSSASLYSVVGEGIVYINPLVRFPEFILGIIFSRIHYYLSDSCSVPCFHWLKELFRSCVELLQSFLFVFLIFLGLGGLSFSFDVYMSRYFGQILGGICFASLILISANSFGFLFKLLSFRLFTMLGKISLGIYLFHQPL